MTPRTFSFIMGVIYFVFVFLSVDHDPQWAYYPAIALGTGAAVVIARTFAEMIIEQGNANDC